MDMEHEVIIDGGVQYGIYACKADAQRVADKLNQPYSFLGITVATIQPIDTRDIWDEDEESYALYHVELDYDGERQEVLSDVYAQTYNDAEEYIAQHYPTATNITVRFVRTVGK